MIRSWKPLRKVRIPGRPSRLAAGCLVLGFLAAEPSVAEMPWELPPDWRSPEALACSIPETEAPAEDRAETLVEIPVEIPAAVDAFQEALVEEACRRISRKLASVGYEECRAARLSWTGRSSVLGTPLLIREFPPREERYPLGRVLLIGGIHGDEYSSVSVVFKWLATLDRHHSGLFHWRVAPLVNPDGLLRRRSRRMNENGVDLNRNFPCPDWHAATSDYWVRRTSKNPRRYPGPDPLSEPESRWLAEEIEQFRPDIIVSVHAPHNVLDFDGPPEAPERLGPLQLQLMGTYPGSLGRYAGVHNDLPVVTIELPSAGSMPSPEAQRAIWGDLVGWLQTRLATTRQEVAR